MMDRRAFLGVAAACLGAAARAAETPPARVARIGFLGYGESGSTATQTGQFRAGLRELGWVEGRNATLEYRWAESRAERLAPLVAELVRARVDVIVLSGSVGIRAARSVTRSVPVVFVVLVDPVTLG